MVEKCHSWDFERRPGHSSNRKALLEIHSAHYELRRWFCEFLLAACRSGGTQNTGPTLKKISHHVTHQASRRWTILEIYPLAWSHWVPCSLRKNAKTHLTFLLAKLVNDSSFEEFFDQIFYLSFLVVRIPVRSYVNWWLVW
jgi:hypothetical protein